MFRISPGSLWRVVLCGLLVFLNASCNLPMPTQFTPTYYPIQFTPVKIETIVKTPSPNIFYSKSSPIFQVFILNPIQTCLAGNDFYSGNVCYGKNCGDCNCTWEEFDPPAPLTGIPPDQINQPGYKNFEQRLCFEISLSKSEIDQITGDMLEIHDLVLAWTDGELDLQIEIQTLPFTHTGFVAPDFVFGPFEVDDELLNNYVNSDTDFVYVITGQTDHTKGKSLAGWCGGSYGEMSVHGAGYSYIQFNNSCNSVFLGGHAIYEPFMHEWIHNLDWALYNINQVNDIYQFKSPDWTEWDRKDWPGCKEGASDPLNWFPNIDFCEWDPDWIDCNNESSASACIHAGETVENPSWYEHVISTHYPRELKFNGNFCQDGRMDWGETGIDSGGSCP